MYWDAMSYTIITTVTVVVIKLIKVKAFSTNAVAIKINLNS